MGAIKIDVAAGARPISVCMPYWNRPKELTRSMRAYALTYPNLELEFSICDDGSIMPLERQHENWKVTTLPKHVRAMNPCVPINVAIRAATHDVIVLTNPEVEHRTSVLYQMLEALQGPDDYVSAACIEATTGRPIAGPGTPYGTEGRRPLPPGSDLHFCVMFHRELFDRAGGFNEAYRFGLGCDDNSWLWRLHTVGAQFKRVPGAVWHYRTPHTWTGSLEKNSALLEREFGHLPEFKQCA